MVASQVVIGVAQFGYSGFTGRLLDPSVFGSYSVALSATGFIPLLFATGLPSFVLAEQDLSVESDRAIRRLAWVSGGVGACALFIGAPLWSWVWNAPAATGFARILSVQVLIAAPAAVGLARVRRSGRARSDAWIQALSTLAGLILGLLVLHLTGEPLALTVAPITASLVNLIAAKWIGGLSLQSGSHKVRTILSWTWQISGQNALFFVIFSLPAWAVSVGTDPRMLGQFSRASLLAGMAATALSTALVRVLSPSYRQARNGDITAAVTDAMIVAAGIAMPAFGMLAVVGGLVIGIWLGPGWQDAAEVMPILALGYGSNVLFSVLANAAEMLGRFRDVKYAQLGMAVVGGLLAGLVILTGKLFIGASLVLAVAVVGMVILVARLRRGPVIDAQRLGRALFRQASWTLAIAAMAGAALWVSSRLELNGVVALLLTASIGLFVCLSTLRFQPAWTILRSRGVL